MYSVSIDERATDVWCLACDDSGPFDIANIYPLIETEYYRDVYLLSEIKQIRQSLPTIFCSKLVCIRTCGTCFLLTYFSSSSSFDFHLFRILYRRSENSFDTETSFVWFLFLSGF